MLHAAPVDALKVEMGKALEQAIDKQGGKVLIAKRAGLNRATLYRLLRGENVSTEVLLRTLRALGRSELINELITPPVPSPLELRPPVKERRTLRTKESTPASSASTPRAKESLVKSLTLGRLPSGE